MSTVGTIALMPVALGEHRLAVDALSVLEILGTQRWVAIPNAPPLLPGALAWRGRALGVFDLGPALEQPRLEVPHTRNRNAIIKLGEDHLAMSVDRVLEVRSLPREQVKPVHATGWLADGGLPCVGEFELDGEMIAILDLELWVRRMR
jgi:chemotaxis signal transduction protein